MGRYQENPGSIPRMATITIIFIYLFFRIVDLVVATIAPYFLPYLGFFPYKEILDLSRLPYFLSGFGNFDGVHYIRIASHGYDNFEQAFFPLYPLVIRMVSIILGGRMVFAGIVVSWFFGGFGLVLLAKYLETIGLKKDKLFWTILFICFYPTSFYFGAIYGESLFLFLLFLSLYSLGRHNQWLASIAAFFAALTRLAGVFIFFPFFIELWLNPSRKQIRGEKTTIKVLITLMPILGLFVYMGYLYQTTGDPFYFVTAQPAFGAYRSTTLILLPQVVYRYLKIFITAKHDFRYFVSVFEFFSFVLMFVAVLSELWQIWKNKKKDWLGSRLGLAVFSLVYLLLPTMTGTLSSMPRYSSMAISAYIFFSEINSRVIKVLLAGLFFAVHTVVLAYFIQGYFVG